MTRVRPREAPSPGVSGWTPQLWQENSERERLLAGLERNLQGSYSPEPAPGTPRVLAAAREGTPIPQAVWKPLIATLPSAAGPPGFLILAASCPHLPTATVCPWTQFGVRALLISHSGSARNYQA